MEKAEQFEIVELGTTYKLPKYRVVDGQGIKLISNFLTSVKDHEQEITFVRGDKTDNGQVIPRVDGVIHEQLLGVMITDLEYKYSIIPADESKEAIKNLKLALFWLEERQREREKRNVNGTYQK